MKYLVDWLFFLSIVIVFWKIKWTKPFKAINEDYLSLKNSNAMKGVFSLTPLIVHIANSGIGYSAPLNWWTINGNAVVEGFFFFAGFGLMKQYMQREDYCKNFLRKRMPKILIPYILMILLYWAGTFVFYGFLYPPSGVVNTFICGKPIVTYSWFVVHLILFYLFFWILMLVCKKHYRLMILGGVIYYVVTSWLFYRMGFEVHWHETSIGPAIGMAWAVYEKQILKFMKKWYWPAFAVTIALTVMFFKVDIPWLYNLLPSDFALNNVIIFIMLFMCILLFMMKFEIGNPITDFLGSISFEIYLVHGFIIMALKNTKYSLENDVLFTILVMVGTILAAWCFKMCMDYVFKIIYRKR